MLFASSRNILRLNKTRAAAMLPTMAVRSYSSATSDEYHSLDDQMLHELKNPVAFQGDKAAVFDSTDIQERRFVPFELKELTFKCSAGCMGVFVWDYMYHFGFYSEVFAAAFVMNWAYKSMTIMGSTVRKIELHKDGKTVTVSPRIGSPWAVKISEVRKLEHEKELI